ncbi:hypothetical protein [Paraburkholderia graminis]|uniref:hypothetical protein n=1 Tax=Paraburkholderia graminis TaxID=60548 RepID=UPI0038BB821D
MNIPKSMFARTPTLSNVRANGRAFPQAELREHLHRVRGTPAVRRPAVDRLIDHRLTTKELATVLEVGALAAISSCVRSMRRASGCCGRPTQ